MVAIRLVLVCRVPEIPNRALSDGSRVHNPESENPRIRSPEASPTPIEQALSYCIGTL